MIFVVAHHQASRDCITIANRTRVTAATLVDGAS